MEFGQIKTNGSSVSPESERILHSIKIKGSVNSTKCQFYRIFAQYILEFCGSLLKNLLDVIGNEKDHKKHIDR